MRTASSNIVDQITTATDKKFEPVARMADAIINVILQNGDCLPADLQAQGFAANEVATLWHFAHSLAVIELSHMENNVPSFSLKEVRYA